MCFKFYPRGQIAEMHLYFNTVPPPPCIRNLINTLNDQHKWNKVTEVAEISIGRQLLISESHKSRHVKFLIAVI